MEHDFAIGVVSGFLAQMVDGALGMAYGVTATTFLLSLGLPPPAAASASVHAAEVFTAGASGISHLVLRNVDRRLFARLVIPGVLGSSLGAYALTSLPLRFLQTGVALYLAAMGLVILRKAVQNRAPGQEPKRLSILGLLGGFCDAMGGGGWGPIVTTTLVARGGSPRFAIGSVNLAEFFVALAASVTFLLTIGLDYWHMVLGLILGGILAAPLAAPCAGRSPHGASCSSSAC